MTDGAWVVAELDGNLIGLAAESVLGVMPPPAVTPIPFAPDFVDGIIGAGGDVVPLIDLSRRLGGRGTPASHEVLRMRVGNSAFALRVDRVVSMAQLSLDDGIEPAHDQPASIGIWRWRDRSVCLLDARQVGMDDIAIAEEQFGGEGMVAQVAASAPPTAAAHTETAMLVELAGKRLGLPLAAVHEVIEIEHWTAVPQSPLSVLGLSFPRNAPLLLLSLARLTGAADTETAARLFVVVERDGARFGMAVDRVIGMRAFAERSENALIGTPHGIAGHYIDADGTPIDAVEIDQLIDDGLLGMFRSLARSSEAQAKGELRIETRQFLTFAVGAETCALPIEAIERVMEYSPPQPLPSGGPDAIKGAIEVQGRIIPVAIARECLAKEHRTDSGFDGQAAYLVLRLADGPLALMVDRVYRILPVPIDRIEMFGGEGASVIVGVGRFDNRVLWILAPDRLAPAVTEDPA